MEMNMFNKTLGQIKGIYGKPTMMRNIGLALDMGVGAGIGAMAGGKDHRGSGAIAGASFGGAGNIAWNKWGASAISKAILGRK